MPPKVVNGQAMQTPSQSPNASQSPAQTSLSFADVPVTSLEAIRPRLTQLTRSIRLFEDSMRQATGNGPVGTAQASVLPSWTYLQNQYNVILSQLTSLAKALDENKDILTHTNVYPNTEFPAIQNEGLLTTMLRKKHLPEIVEWIEESYKTTEEFASLNMLSSESDFSLKCLRETQALLSDYNFMGYLTKEEEDSGVSLPKEFQVQDVGPSGSQKPGDGEGLSYNDVYKFIYQGTDSKILID